ncbi:peptidyl-prolyl cis-trans isomerase [Burkholderia multivorans]|uniref:peptidylprolyl isomerase n=1 Tax=Burkholderia multivorans TaxID=87883 RepID=UPI001C256A56|nr:peptidylprolyl isomerase [Burkholderia multivorans]MBU9374304.1 peptidyl-prolyl cis-trans isomerase [Burkholderia multivorans]
MKKISLYAIPVWIALVSAAGVAHVAAAEPQPTALPKGVAALVDNRPIAQADIESAVSASGQPDTPALRAQIKRDLIVRELIEQAADRANYGSRPEVLGIVSRARSEAAANLYLHDTVRPEPVTDAQVRARYDAIVAAAGQFEYRAQVIAVRDAATADAAIAELKQGAAFDAVANKYNTVANAGVAEWVSLKTPIAEGNTGGLPVPVAETIASTQPGAIAGPVQVGQAFMIVKLAEKRPTIVPTFEQAKGVLRQQLEARAKEQAVNALVEQLASRATIRQ